MTQLGCQNNRFAVFPRHFFSVVYGLVSDCSICLLLFTIFTSKNLVWKMISGKNSIRWMTFMLYIPLLNFCTMKYLATNEKPLCMTLFSTAVFPRGKNNKIQKNSIFCFKKPVQNFFRKNVKKNNVASTPLHWNLRWQCEIMKNVWSFQNKLTCPICNCVIEMVSGLRIS